VANRGARIRLQKRIPTHAGLGGGSSDAAATLLVLARLWELNCSWDELLTIAAQLGADVPFFFYGGTVKASGIGEQLETLEDVEQKFFLIVKPNANISTADAYRALDERSLTSPIPETILSSSQQRDGISTTALADGCEVFSATTIMTNCAPANAQWY